MVSSDKYRYLILKEYGLIVDFDGYVVRNNVPGYVENETFGQWKHRVFGEKVTDVSVYYPSEIFGKHRMSVFRKRPDAVVLTTFFYYVSRKFPNQQSAMSAREAYGLGVAREYGLIVNFDGDVSRKAVPRQVTKETANQWRHRVFGDSVSEVLTYFRTSIPPKTQMAIVRADAAICHLENILGYLARESRAVRTEVAQKTTREIANRLERFAGETLDDLVKELPALRPKVRELVDNLIKRTKEGTCSEEFLRTLLSAHVGALRELKFQ